MIGSSRQEAALAALREDGAAVRAELAALATQVAVLAARVEVGLERQATSADGWTRLNERVDRLEASLFSRIDAQSGIAKAQEAALATFGEEGERRATAVAALEEAGERGAEAIRQLRADVARLGRQAAGDLSEMRATQAALAELLLARSPDHGADRPASSIGPA